MLTLEIIRQCARCGARYDHRRSLALLRLTYCSAMCEGADLGFDIRRATGETR